MEVLWGMWGVSLGLWRDVVVCSSKVDTKMGTRCKQAKPRAAPAKFLEMCTWLETTYLRLFLFTGKYTYPST